MYASPPVSSFCLQLSELVNVEGYGEWIRLVAEFTFKSLQSWQVNCCLKLFLIFLYLENISSIIYCLCVKYLFKYTEVQPKYNTSTYKIRSPPFCYDFEHSKDFEAEAFKFPFIHLFPSFTFSTPLAP